MRLTNRLNAIANMLEGVSSVADIGCDHGKLSIYLAMLGYRVVAADMSEKALKRAESASKRAKTPLDLRVGDGFTVLERGEVEAAVIAGLGGREILRILLDAGEKARGIRLVLQPMQRQDELRAGLYENGFRITGEALVKDEKLFELLTVESGTPIPPPKGWPPGFFELGWHYVMAKSPLVPELIGRRMREIKKRLVQAEKSSPGEARDLLIRRLEGYKAVEALYNSL